MFGPQEEDLMIWISFVNSLHDDTKFQQQNNSTFFFRIGSYLEVVRKGTLSVVSLFSFLLYFNPNTTSFLLLLLFLPHLCFVVLLSIRAWHYSGSPRDKVGCNNKHTNVFRLGFDHEKPIPPTYSHKCFTKSSIN